MKAFKQLFQHNYAPGDITLDISMKQRLQLRLCFRLKFQRPVPALFANVRDEGDDRQFSDTSRCLLGYLKSFNTHFVMT